MKMSDAKGVNAHEPKPGRVQSIIRCADGATHYGVSQTERFSEERLLAQADFAGCGPHVVTTPAGTTPPR